MITISPDLEQLIESAAKARSIGDNQTARRALQEAFTTARTRGDALAEAGALVEQGIMCLAVDQDTAGAYQCFSTALEVYTRIPSNTGSALAMSYLGRIARQERRVEEAYDWSSKALALYGKENDSRGRAVSLHFLGLLDKDRKDFDLAEQRFCQSLVIFYVLDDKSAVGQSLLSLAGISIDYHKDRHHARLLLSKALEMFKELGLTVEMNKTLYYLSRMED